MSEQATSPDPAQRRRGCFLPGCITLVVLVFLSIAGLVFGYLSFLHRFTSKQPATFPASTLSAEQMEQLRQRTHTFQDAVRAAEPSPPLSLSSEDLNALLTIEPALQPFTNRIHISGLADQSIKAQISVPLDKVRFPLMKGRFINGDATFKVSITNGTAILHVEQVIVRDRPFPDRFMDMLRERNLATELNNNPRASVALNRLKSIEVKDGKLVLTPEEN
jgi:hypothetical protein